MPNRKFTDQSSCKAGNVTYKFGKDNWKLLMRPLRNEEGAMSSFKYNGTKT